MSTIFVGGFPPDASPRELDNLCRFLPGFVTSNVSMQRGSTLLFVLFEEPAYAHAAIEVLNGQQFDRAMPAEPLRATMARSNMRSTSGPAAAAAAAAAAAGLAAPPSYYGRSGAWGGAPPGQPPPPSTPPPPGHPGTNGGARVVPPPSRARSQEDPSQVDTVASVGAAEAGFDEASLRAFYQSLPGFMDFKGNPRLGGGFAKFTSAALAAQAVELAQAEGIPAEMARSSMQGPGGGGAPRGGSPPPQMIIAPVAARPAAVPHTVPPPKRPRIPEDPSQIDTVASVGAVEAGLDEASLAAFFQQLPGFVAFKGNPRMGGGFAKFESPELAAAAVQASQEQGVPVEMAKSSMSVP